MLALALAQPPAQCIPPPEPPRSSPPSSRPSSRRSQTPVPPSRCAATGVPSGFFFVVPHNMIAVPRNVIVVPQNMIAQNMIAAPQNNDSSAVAFCLPSSACPTAAYSFGAFAAKLTPPATPFSHRTLLRCPMLAGMRRRRSTACSSAAQRSPRFQKAGPPGEGPPPSQKLG